MWKPSQRSEESTYKVLTFLTGLEALFFDDIFFVAIAALIAFSAFGATLIIPILEPTLGTIFLADCTFFSTPNATGTSL